MMGKSRKWLTIAGLAAAVTALLLFVELFEPWNTNLWWREVFNFGHLPLFGTAAILLLRLTAFDVGQRLPVLGRYGAALAITIFLAALSEAVQIEGPRDADFDDFLRDVVGGLSFLLIRLASDPTARQTTPALSARRGRSILMISAVALIAISAFPLARLSVVWVNRNQASPTLFSFEHWWERTFVTADNATAAVVLDDEGEPADSADHALRVDFRAATYTGLILQDFYPDWRSSSSLRFSVYSLSPQIEQLRLRIDDLQAKNQREDRFERIIDLPPGNTEVRLPLVEIAHGLPNGRAMDLSRVKRIVLFSAAQPRREFTLWFDDFALH